ncbi:hypothetical protein M5U04_05610 [Xenorhabdus sp. XENO-1]|uniref:hypothetical protein n=1 Tax=Xenorhabdus bovienii TaxID=40576 RepID=UPI0020CA5F65|nr:hypothetical protein [Xenorhabdus bovienii]MCP9267586.1 hypothetical protein [Xenorhabdus bovienii subsp. africana]
MLNRETIEAVMMELAYQQEQSLTGRDRLAIRTGVAQTLQAKERHRRRMTAPTYQWMKPAPKR